MINLHIIFLIYSFLMGSPYLATKKKQVDLILKVLKPKKRKIFYELGCGDGRIVRRAVKKYEVLGYGFDVNPLLLCLAKFFARRDKLKNIFFKRKNILKINYQKADYVYLFFLPELMEKIKKKLENELPKEAIIISHGFPFLGWEKKLFKKIEEKSFSTYFYKK